MVRWIKKISNLIAFFTFFVVAFSALNWDDPLAFESFGFAIIKGLIGGFLFWIVGFIISDIVLKGIVEDIPQETLDTIEGGLIQRISESKNTPKVIFPNPTVEGKDNHAIVEDKKKK